MGALDQIAVHDNFVMCDPDKLSIVERRKRGGLV